MATAGVYFIPGIGEVAIAVTGVITIAGAIITAVKTVENIRDYLSDEERKNIAILQAKIPERIRLPNGNVDLGKFTIEVKGKKAFKEKGGYTIEKDNSGHGGHHNDDGGKEWKLKDKKGERVASLDKNGKVVSK
ncbi:hypothetical protein H8356DRAFT_1424381 [Neocallimastix lanati (nom. inval.)]|uniref:Uncharacterized protein n=1 Tax=Neocallimastix californiae TaxID=1754190 RepID=A0A1Y2AKT0_9FUNG|nr:hypothetical protein H8356DRAFT_1424381 [Neocallimastix sp. JGI-2020a]ORY23169.1 hypothetical protein LY90DRAFT_515164 [Neocallimastix californiae]|eukprot:ORY23169.1 hypothetical protein LY90DRAFT_515164 [Neocallimastix californiae]